ncbi:hypothetical protein AB0C14_22685 [Microbispora hainanensis]|uniref:hypothetical protein n=1 Tax=Microbispora hainanensis TaxID=568844 RepID=UPI0033DF5F8B
MLLTQPHRLQRAVIVALAVLPLLAIILLSLPVWLVLPFFKEGRAFILELVEKMTDALKAFIGASKEEAPDAASPGAQ